MGLEPGLAQRTRASKKIAKVQHDDGELEDSEGQFPI